MTWETALQATICEGGQDVRRRCARALQMAAVERRLQTSVEERRLRPRMIPVQTREGGGEERRIFRKGKAVERQQWAWSVQPVAQQQQQQQQQKQKQQSARRLSRMDCSIPPTRIRCHRHWH
jgi:hypothetical protein